MAAVLSDSRRLTMDTVATEAGVCRNIETLMYVLSDWHAVSPRAREMRFDISNQTVGRHRLLWLLRPLTDVLRRSEQSPSLYVPTVSVHTRPIELSGAHRVPVSRARLGRSWTGTVGTCRDDYYSERLATSGDGYSSHESRCPPKYWLHVSNRVPRALGLTA